MRVTAETKNATRQRILEIARKQFAENGFEATTTRDIAREASIAAGTLFNYFPTKESIAMSLVEEACTRAAESFQAARRARGTQTAGSSEPHAGTEELSLEEELFAHIADVLRKLKPFRKYLPAVLDTALSPLVHSGSVEESIRGAHLETVSEIISRHGCQDAVSTMSLHLYWTLYTGVLAFWAIDASPRQEDTLALLDQSLAMFVGWLTSQSGSAELPKRTSNSNASLSRKEPPRKRG